MVVLWGGRSDVTWQLKALHDSQLSLRDKHLEAAPPMHLASISSVVKTVSLQKHNIYCRLFLGNEKAMGWRRESYLTCLCYSRNCDSKAFSNVQSPAILKISESRSMSSQMFWAMEWVG